MINSEEQMDHFLFGDQNTSPNIIYKLPEIMTRGIKKILKKFYLRLSQSRTKFRDYIGKVSLLKLKNVYWNMQSDVPSLSS